MTPTNFFFTFEDKIFSPTALIPAKQCDQTGQFIALWTIFQSLWQQLFCPNQPHFYAIFGKVSKPFIFLMKSFLGNFYRHLATFYWSHCRKVTVFHLVLPLPHWFIQYQCLRKPHLLAGKIDS